MIYQYIPDLIRPIAEKVNQKMLARTVNPFPVRFAYGRYTDIVEENGRKDGAITDAARLKYPLIWLVTDIVEEKGQDMGVYATPSLHIIIATLTDFNYTMEERKEKVLFPYLVPIYQELIKQFAKSRDFIVAGEGLIRHQSNYRPYWKGEDGQSVTNLFNDYVDAMQLKNLILPVQNKIC